jgi:hypothetical protein
LTGSGESQVSVSSAPLPGMLAIARGIGSDIVVMPRPWADDGRAVYGESTLFLVKELRAEGLTAAFLDSGEDRVFEVKKSALLAGLVGIDIGIGSGVGSNAVWAGLMRLLHRHAGDENESCEVEVTYVDRPTRVTEPNTPCADQPATSSTPSRVCAVRHGLVMPSRLHDHASSGWLGIS